MSEEPPMTDAPPDAGGVVSTGSDTKECPYCAETIKAAAIVCKHCGRDIPSISTTNTHPQVVRPPDHIAHLRRPSNAQSGEKTYFEDSLVTVTKSRAIISGKTYAMANITSVTMFTEPANYSIAICLGLFALLSFALSNPVLIIGSIVCTIIACFIPKPKYWVRIGSASAESNAIFSHDSNYISRIVAAMNEAIVSRG